jgi:hypothetical protein
MRLRRNEHCPIHGSLSCCGRESIRKERKATIIRMGVQRVEDPHHPRGYRELRWPAEMRKLLNRKIVEQGRKSVLGFSAKSTQGRASTLMASGGVVLPGVRNGDSHHHLAGIAIPHVAQRYLAS